MEKEIERIKILQYDCLNDEYLNNLAIKYEILDYYDIKESMRQLQQRLVTIKNSSVYIKNVSAHILNVQKTISSNNGVDSIDMERYREIRVPVGLKGAQIISYKNRFFLSTLQQKYVNPVCLIEVELNQDASTDAANTAQADEKDPFGKYDPAIDISFVRTIDDDTSSNILPKTPGETMEDNQGSPEGII